MNLIKSSDKHGEKPFTNKKSKFPTDYLETLSAKVSIKINKIMKVGLESSRLGAISHYRLSNDK